MSLNLQIEKKVSKLKSTAPSKSLPGELVQLLPLGASLVALDRLEGLLGVYPEAKPRKHGCLLDIR